MARKRRELRGGMMYHVMARGNERKKIFERDGDREMFLGLLSGAFVSGALSIGGGGQGELYEAIDFVYTHESGEVEKKG